jgi:hypothetical protein
LIAVTGYGLLRRPEPTEWLRATLTRKEQKMFDRHGDDVVRLVTASNPQEAHLWRQALEDQGIRCRVDEYFGGFAVVPPAYPVPELWVHQEDAERAQSILNGLRAATCRRIRRRF